MADGYNLARKALSTLEFFQEAYAGAEEYQVIHKQVVGYLHSRAEMAQHRGEWDAKFLSHFADCLDQANKPGPLVQRQG